MVLKYYYANFQLQWTAQRHSVGYFPRVFFSGIRRLDIIVAKSPTGPFLSDFIQLMYSNPIRLRLIVILVPHFVREILGGLFVFQTKFANAVLVSPRVLLPDPTILSLFNNHCNITNKREHLSEITRVLVNT